MVALADSKAKSEAVLLSHACFSDRVLEPEHKAGILLWTQILAF